MYQTFQRVHRSRLSSHPNPSHQRHCACAPCYTERANRNQATFNVTASTTTSCSFPIWSPPTAAMLRSATSLRFHSHIDNHPSPFRPNNPARMTGQYGAPSGLPTTGPAFHYLGYLDAGSAPHTANESGSTRLPPARSSNARATLSGTTNLRRARNNIPKGASYSPRWAANRKALSLSVYHAPWCVPKGHHQ